MATATHQPARPQADYIAAAEALAPVFAGRAEQHDRDASFAFENFDDLRDAGLLNLGIPVEEGGDGQGLAVRARVLRTIAAGDPSTALVLAMHYNQHAGLARNRRWPDEVYRRVVTDSLDGIALINALRVEPDLGTPARGGLPATTARRTADGWSLTGHKIYATGSPILRYYTVWARTDEETPRVGNFLVPAESPGVRIVETWDHLGMRASGSHDAIFEDVALPSEFAVDIRLPGEWGGDPIGAVTSALAFGSVYHGVAVSARDWIVQFSKDRVPANLGQPLASLPRFQTGIGKIQSLLLVNERLMDGLAERTDERGATPDLALEANVVKYVTTNNATDAVHVAMDLAANPGLSRHSPLERHLRDVMCARVHTPQDDTVLLNLGAAALGVKR
ncbi:MAG: acyl-CoA/acyl-ACP dehydrogenase [Dehalococcoidia bacterium]|nr:acyl-CoA/acyl-ACP dehydrogenase [Dehalococcoidia bacterium]